MCAPAPTPDLPALARHIDRIRRLFISARPDVVARDLPRAGWISVQPGAAPAQFPSTSLDRVYWLSPEAPITAGDIAAALAAARGLGSARLYAWLAPWAWTEHTETLLNDAGFRPWPHVDYIALTRPCDPCAAPSAPAAAPFTVRILDSAEVPSVLDRAMHWYGPAAGAIGGATLARRAATHIHAAFLDDLPIAFGLLTPDGPWAYLGAAATDPNHRRRGFQSALIASRLRHAATLGARWCATETNTANPTSLHNLRRAGFRDAIHWRVYGRDTMPPKPHAEAHPTTAAPAR